MFSIGVVKRKNGLVQERVFRPDVFFVKLLVWSSRWPESKQDAAAPLKQSVSRLVWILLKIKECSGNYIGLLLITFLIWRFCCSPDIICFEFKSLNLRYVLSWCSGNVIPKYPFEPKHASTIHFTTIASVVLKKMCQSRCWIHVWISFVRHLRWTNCDVVEDIVQKLQCWNTSRCNWKLSEIIVWGTVLASILASRRSPNCDSSGSP